MPFILSSPSSTAEALTFDPADEATGSTLELMVAPFNVSRMEFPAPPPKYAWAGSIDTEGDSLAVANHENRRVTLTIEVDGTSQTALDGADATLEAKIAKVFREGGTLRRTRADG